MPQRQRQELVQRFQTDPTCKLFVTTNAGSTGLNLQAANTVINVDLPWNPAVLEQRNIRSSLASCLDQDAQGKPRLVIPIPDAAVVDNFAQSIAKLLGPGLARVGKMSEMDKTPDHAALTR